MADKDVRPGDVVIEKLWLYSDDGQRNYDLRDQAVALDIFESITSPIIVAKLRMLDAIDLLREFPIIGEEYVEIEFKLPNSEKSTSYKLHVKSVDSLETMNQQTAKAYILTLVSMEMIQDAENRVDGRLAGSRDSNNVLRGKPTHEAIGTILTEYLETEKTYSPEPTKGLDEVLITRIKPFVAIDLLRRRALSLEYKSNSFCFFENQRGYVFSTLERLFDEGRKVIGDKVFWTDTDTQNDITQNMFRNIIGYKQIQFADTIDKINQGGLKNNVGVFDITSKTYRKIEYIDNEKNDEFKTVEGKALGQNSSAYTNKHSKTTSKTLFMLQDGARSELDLAEKITYLTAYVQKIVQNLVHIHVWGDNLLTAGDVIKCYLPKSWGMSDRSRTEDRLSSSNFLVSKLAHHITINSGARPIYTISMELIKGGILEK